jgi:hypothetical protein
VAGYFFYYGHYYASLCIEQLKGPEADGYRDRLAGFLGVARERRELVGLSFYAYHQPHGTSFAVMTLLHCRHAVTEAPSGAEARGDSQSKAP